MPAKTADKILYLDYDGVLQHESVVWHPKRSITITAPGHSFFEWLPILDELLTPHPAVAIVLSTSWVRARSYNFARSKLTPKLQERVIGATFHRREMNKMAFERLPRGEQIANDVFRRGAKAWFAIDDDDYGWPEWCRNHLIKTNGSTGISDQHIQAAIRHFLSVF